MKQLPKQWRRRVFRAMPRRRHLRGGRLHRVLGEGLFRHELWALTEPELTKGLALGLFIGCTPTMGVQIALCGVAAFFLRVNIPIALLATLISNPLTAPILYPLEYKLGVWLIGVPESPATQGLSGAFGNFVRYARPLWAGSFITATVVSAAGYGLAKLIARLAPMLARWSHRFH